VRDLADPAVGFPVGRSDDMNGGCGMFAVIVTALATWAMMLVMEVVNLGNFLVEGTVAVIVGAAVGLMVPWYRARQRRANR
jgi:hypothetical protein